MAKYNYAFDEFDVENMARAVGRDLPISTKQSIEICNSLRRKKVQRAKAILNDVISMNKAMPYTRFTDGTGHKPGIGPGRYPIKASQTILKIIESVEVNAQQKGLNTSNLVVRHICVQSASQAWHYGRKRRRKMKRTHVEIVVEEKGEKRKEKPQEKKEATKDVKDAKPKAQEKTETKKILQKEEKPKEVKKEESKVKVEEKGENLPPKTKQTTLNKEEESNKK